MKRFFMILFILILGVFACEDGLNSNNPITSLQKVGEIEDLGLSGAWTIGFLHSSGCAIIEEVFDKAEDVEIDKIGFVIDGIKYRPKCKVSITFHTLLERYWLDIDPDGPVANRTWNSKSLYGQTTFSEFRQRCGGNCDLPYVEDNRVWEWVHYWWPFIFPSEDRLSGTAEGIMYKHPYYYLSWTINYSRRTLESLYRFRGKLTLEDGQIINFFGVQKRRDPMVVIGGNNSNSLSSYHSENEVFRNKYYKDIKWQK